MYKYGDGVGWGDSGIWMSFEKKSKRNWTSNTNRKKNEVVTRGKWRVVSI